MRAGILKGWSGMWRACGLLVVCVVLAGIAGAAPAYAEGVPFWHVSQSVAPRYIPPGGEGVLDVSVTNLGDAPAEGVSSPVVVTDMLPAGLTATSAEAKAVLYGGGECTVGGLVLCTYTESLPPFEPLEISIHVTASKEEASLTDEATVSGGGAPSVTVHEPVSVGSSSAAFGVESVEQQAFNENGSLDTQAGSHPFELHDNAQPQPGVLIVLRL